MAQQTEYGLQLALCNYIKYQYPDVIFRSDLGGIRLTPGLARKAKSIQQGRGFPDLFICEARYDIRSDLTYFGLFIEVKVKPIYKKNGDFVSEHVAEQNDVINKLNQKGYLASFGVGFEDCKDMIDGYLRMTPIGRALR